MSIWGDTSSPKKEHKTVLGFASNLLGDVAHTGANLVNLAIKLNLEPLRLGYAALPGGQTFTGRVANDAAIGRAIISHPGQLLGLDYYKPLIHGQYGKFADNVYNHPFQLGLDVATLATLGGAGAAKAAGVAGRIAEEGSLLARAAEKVAAYDRVSAEVFKSLPTSDAIKGVIKARDGSYLVPKKFDVGGLHKYEMPRNPVVRARKQAMENLYKRAPEEGLGSYFHPVKRGARLSEAKTSRDLTRAAGNAVRTLSHESKRATRAERYAAALIATMRFKSPEEYLAYRAWRRSNLEAETNPRYRAYMKRDLNLLAEAEPLILQPNARVAHISDLMQETSDRVQAARAARGQSVDASAEAFAKQQQKIDNIVAQQSKARAGSNEAADLQSRLDVEVAKLDEMRGSHRASLPRRLAGLSFDPAQALAVVSHSSRRIPRAVRREVARTNKTTGALKTAEDLFNSGVAFTKAMHDNDPMRLAQSYAMEMKHVKKLTDFKHMLQIAERYNPDDEVQRAGILSGKLRVIRADSPDSAALIKQVDEVSSFVRDRLAPVDRQSADMAKLIDDWMSEVHGSGLVLPEVAVRELTSQAHAAQGLLVRLLKTPTRVWRDLTLSLKGSFYVNNFLGNLLLGFVAYGPKYFVELARSGSKRSKLGKIIHEADPNMEHGALNALSDMSAAEIPQMPIGAAAKVGTVVRHPLDTVSRIADFLATQGAKVTENNLRRSAGAIEIRRAVKNLSKNRGISKDEALNQIVNDADAFDELMQRAYNNMLDYSKLTTMERDYIRPLYPFWNFMRAITGRYFQLVLDEPWKIEVMRKMSEIGAEQNAQGMFIGLDQKQIPAYLQGLVPIGPTKDGKTPVYSSYAANPFSTVADLAHMAQGVIDRKAAGEAQSPFAAMNPYLRSAVEAGTRKDMFLGAPLTGSTGDIFVSQLAKNFPQYATYDRARHPNPNAVVSRTLQQQVMQYLGVPVGTFNRQAYDRAAAIDAYYERKSEQLARNIEAKRQRRDIGWDLGLRDKVGV